MTSPQFHPSLLRVPPEFHVRLAYGLQKRCFHTQKEPRCWPFAVVTLGEDYEGVVGIVALFCIRLRRFAPKDSTKW